MKATYPTSLHFKALVNKKDLGVLTNRSIITKIIV